VINTDKVRGGLGLWLSNGNYSATFYIKKYNNANNLVLLQPFSVFGSDEAQDYIKFIQLNNDLVEIQKDVLKRNILKSVFLEEFIQKHKNSHLALFFLQSSMIDCGTSKIKELFALLSSELQQSDEGMRLLKEIEKIEQNSIGSKINDFTIKDMLGENKTASTIIKSYTILSFWSSWCAPCRVKNQELVKQYSLFKDKSVQLINISLDYNKKHWENAVKKDNLHGLQLSELKGFESAIVKQFKITSIPYTLLVDKDLKIVAIGYDNILAVIKSL
jgi:peroxiredoxin